MLTLAGLGLVVVGAFLPWVASGSATRSSFAAVRTAEALDLVPDGALGVVVQGWYLLPLVASLTVLGLALGHRWAVVGPGAVVVLAAGGLAVLTLVAPVASLAGPLVALVGAAVLSGGLVQTLRSTVPAVPSTAPTPVPGPPGGGLSPPP